MVESVNPKRVLQLINNMGYKNVSANELKDFTKDVKKLIKYEQKLKSTSLNATQVFHGPENVINVTIIKEASPKKCDPQPVASVPKAVQTTNIQSHDTESETEVPVKQTKRLLRLPRHVKTKNPNIVYRKGIVSGVKDGVLIRNTPTDLYQKYQEDWIKFKSYIPGENSRQNIRKNVREKLQHKDDDDAKVYVHFPNEKGERLL